MGPEATIALQHSSVLGSFSSWKEYARKRNSNHKEGIEHRWLCFSMLLLEKLSRNGGFAAPQGSTAGKPTHWKRNDQHHVFNHTLVCSGYYNNNVNQGSATGGPQGNIIQPPACLRKWPHSRTRCLVATLVQLDVLTLIKIKRFTR